MPLLAQSESAMLMSFFKPVLILLTLTGWAFVITKLDKDAAYFYLKRYVFNSLQIVAGVIGFGLMLLIPLFFIGYVIGLLPLIAGIAGYIVYRNGQVPDAEKWDFSLETVQSWMQEKGQQHAQKEATVTLLTDQEQPIPVPGGNDPMVPAHDTLQTLMSFAVPRGADRIDCSVDTEQAKITVRIDGVRYPQESIEPRDAMLMIDYAKSAAQLDVGERRKKQTGRFKVDLGVRGRHTIEMTTAGSTRGVNLIMVINPSQLANIKFEALGMLPSQRKKLAALLDQQGKIVIVAAPPGQGTTTTLYSLLQRHDPYTESVMTLEQSQPFNAEGVAHNLIEPGTPSEKIGEQIAALLRADPNVLMLDKLHNPKSAPLLAKSSEDVRIYLPLPTDDGLTAIKVWLKAVGDMDLGAESLGAVLSQRLVRKLCHTCRVAFKPDPAALKKLNLPADKVSQLYTSSGKVMVKEKPTACPDCLGIGYRGRTAVYETMIFDDGARKLASQKQFDGMVAHMRKHGLILMQEVGLAKVVEGVTDIKELTRAMNEKHSRSS